MTTGKRHVFLSYCPDNEKEVQRLRADLIAGGETVWWGKDILGGQYPKFEIHQAMRNAYAVLVCFSKESEAKARSEIYSEAVDAINAYREYAPGKTFLIPVRLSECEIPSLEIDGTRTLDRLQHVDLFPASEYAAGLERLLTAIRNVADRPAVVSSRPVYLPPKPTNCVHRDLYFDQLRAALVTNPGRFLLSGVPGCGKSTLAVMFAWQVQQQFEAVLFQTCGPRPVELIAGDLADTLKGQIGDQVIQLPPLEKVRALRNWLEQRRALLVLDDVWLNDNASPRNEGALHLQDLLPGLRVSVLFTSRAPMLPWVDAERKSDVVGFSPEETEEVFRSYLGRRTMEASRQQLLEFAERVERLPLAVSAAAQLLQNQFGPLGEAAQSLKVEQLRTQIDDVPGLLQRAIQAQGWEERRLLMAAAVCVPEGFWLPLAMSIAGLSSSQGGQARSHLVNAGLLRVLDQDRQRFDMHALLRDQLHNDAWIAEFRQAHARALDQFFGQWENKWKECRECLPEIPRVAKFLWSKDRRHQSRLSFQGYACAKRVGELEHALHIERQNEQLWSSVSGSEGKARMQSSYGNQAVILQVWGRQNEAMALLKKQEALCKKLRDKEGKHGLQASYGNQARTLKVWGRLENAMTLLKKQEALCKELSNNDGLQDSYGYQAVILRDWGRLEEAMALLKKQRTICERLGNKDGLQISYAYQGLILVAWGRLKEAMTLHKKQQAICEKMGNKHGLQSSYGSQALILAKWGRLKEAMVLLNEQQAICEELGNKNGFQAIYGNQALILQDWGQLEKAMALLKKQEELCEELGIKDGLHSSYGYQAAILYDWGRLKEAMILLKKKEAICRKLSNKNGLQASYGNQALILQEWEQPKKAMALLKKQETLCQELGNNDGLQASYGNQALILQAWGQLRKAMILHKKQEALCKELGNRDGLQRSYGNQALILRQTGSLKEALALHKKEEALCKELGNRPSLAYCYWNWGLLASEMADRNVAQAKLEEALAIFAELKLTKERDTVQEDLKTLKTSQNDEAFPEASQSKAVASR